MLKVLRVPLSCADMLQLIETKKVSFCSVSRFIHVTNTLNNQFLVTMLPVICLPDECNCCFVDCVVGEVNMHAHNHVSRVWQSLQSKPSRTAGLAGVREGLDLV